MARDIFPNEANNFEVVGGMRIGEKAEFLRDLTPALNESGFDVPPTVVLSDELMEDTRGAIRDVEVCRINDEAARATGLFVGRSLAPVVVARSSALADGRGTGVYESFVTQNKWGPLNKAILGVLASYHTEGAQAFREQLGLDDEMGVMLQPVVGQIMDSSEWYTIYSSPLSGTAYTSTVRQPDGVLKFMPGFGAGVQDAGSFQVTQDIMQRLRRDEEVRGDPVLTTVLGKMHSQELEGGNTGKKSPFWTTNDGVYGGGRGTEFAINRKGEFDQIDEATLPYLIEEWATTDDGRFYDTSKRPKVKPTPYGNALNTVRPEEMLEKLAKLERIAGKPIYLEWALTITDKRVPRLWAVQAAPLETRKQSPAESVDFSEIYYQARGVVGESGLRKARKVVVAYNPGAIEHLYEFNADPENEGYVLIYSSRLTATATTRNADFKLISWGDCYRASTILEMQDARHSGSPMEHIQGVAEVTGKLFGVLDWSAMKYGDRSVNLGERMHEWRSDNVPQNAYPLTIYEGEITVVADPRDDLLVVGESKA